MTGVDHSESSLAYAKAHAPKANFLRQSYLEPFGEARFDAAIMISQDYGVLSPEDRKTLLKNVHRALKPGGFFAFDMPSLHAYAVRAENSAPNWYAAKAGFYRPHDHMVLEKHIPYPGIPSICDRITVLDEAVATYKFWQTFFTPETIGEELAGCGFTVVQALANLRGEACDDDSLSLGILCKKA